MIKNITSIIAIFITFIGYIPYIKDILQKKTKPHIYSWILWGLITSLIFALQISHQAGPGSFITLAAAIMCFTVVFLSVKLRIISQITITDKIFFLLALVALIAWTWAKQPLLSTILATSIDLLGFAPTIRKSWSDPHSETLIFYVLNTIRFSLALFSLSTYTLITAFYPISSIAASGLFTLILLTRRKQLSKKTSLG